MKLQEILAQDHSKKNKAELVDMLAGLSQLITLEEYQKVSGIKIEELNDLTKKEILNVVNDFNEHYKPLWERNIGEASSEIISAIFQQMEADENRFSASNAADADFASELNNIDFASLIGGPLDAAVKAQTNASVATANFVKEVGFEYDQDGKATVRKINFNYEEKVQKKDADGNVIRDADGNPELTTATREIEVPLITVMNIPSLRIETVDIDFNVKLNSVFTKDVSSQLGVNADVSGGFGPVKFKVSASYKRSSSTGIKVEKEYTMGVKVKATNDEMPAGLEKVLNLLAA
ncbi:MAG: DUF2589 domain-containing protein [Bacteroidota bacterium]